MSLSMKSVLLAVGAIVAIGVVDAALAQATRAPRASSSVLPTGGGQALIDPSDTVILLLDHQAGLFQTVEDISVSELRANTTLIAKIAALLKIPVITSAFRTKRTEWAADAGDSPIRAARGVRPPQR